MRVYSIQVSVDDPDERCPNGEHIQKILPNRINATVSNASLITGPVITNKNKILIKEIPGSVNIDTTNGEYHCNGSPRMGKISGLFVDAYNRHGTVSGQWTLANEKRNGQDTSGNITGGSVSVSSYNLTGKTDKDAICPTIYDKITISGGCGEGKLVVKFDIYLRKNSSST